VGVLTAMGSAKRDGLIVSLLSPADKLLEAGQVRTGMSVLA